MVVAWGSEGQVLLLQLDGKSKGRTDSELALDKDVATHDLDQVLHQEESQSRAGLVVFALSTLDLTEFDKELILLAVSDATSSILYDKLDGDSVIILVLERDSHIDIANIGKLYTI